MTRPNFSSTPLRLVVYLILSYSLVALFSTLISRPGVKIASASIPAESAKTKTPDSRRVGGRPSALEVEDFYRLQYNPLEQTPTNLLALYFDIQASLSPLRNHHTAISDSFYSHNRRAQIKQALALPAWLLPMPLLPQGGNKIAFTSDRDGSAQLYLMNTDGSAQTALTNNGANNEAPKWSPDNTRILFHSDRDNPFSGSAEVYVMNADGTAQTRLTDNTADDSCAVWSPAGNKIAFQSARNGLYYQVYVMNADGSNQINVSNGNTSDGQPSWSPDGTKIAFTSERDHPGTPAIYVMNADGSNQTRLTFSAAGIRDEQPSWSPDGTKLLFTSTRDSVVESWQETDEEGGIINRTAVRTNKEVYVMGADGSNQIRLTNTLGHDDTPSWSGDGTRIVFRSDRERECCDPVSQVWVMNADGSNQVDLSNSWFGDYCPSWQGRAGNMLPVVNAGGPYNGQADQNIQLNGTGSYDPDGLITNYQWDFGDGTTATGASPTHAFNAAVNLYTVKLTVTDNSGASSTTTTTVTLNPPPAGDNLTSGDNATEGPVTINFDNLPHGTVVTNQYPEVTFSYVGPASLVEHQTYNCPSPSNVLNLADRNFYRSQEIILDFKQPINSFSFYLMGSDNFGVVGKVDVFQNGSYSGTHNINGLSNGHVCQLADGIKTLTNITKIRIYGVTDVNGLAFDSFTFTPVPTVNSVALEQIDSPLDTNPNAGGGLSASDNRRIFPDREFPTDTINRRRVRVRANTSLGQNKTVYFKAFDVDDPSTDVSPVDPNGSAGSDNRGAPATAQGGLSALSAQTDSNGVATVEFTTTMQPGDNFRIVAGTDQAYLNALFVNGVNIKDSTGSLLPTGKAKVTPMLTVWREVHIEVDSMGPYPPPCTGPPSVCLSATPPPANNASTSALSSSPDPSNSNQVILNLDNRPSRDGSLPPPLEENRFQNGRIQVGDRPPFQYYRVVSNGAYTVTIQAPGLNITSMTHVVIWDDDDYNSDDGANLDGDYAEDIEALTQTLSLVQNSDLASQNVFAQAYIRPVYDGGGPPTVAGTTSNNNSDIPFDLNVAYPAGVGPQINVGRNSEANERDDFWVAYILMGYQGDTVEDNDPEFEGATGGVTSTGYFSDDPGTPFPIGGFGSIIFLETDRDIDRRGYDLVIRTAPHELGHQFGLRGDDPNIAEFGIMNPTGFLTFGPRHLNFLRSRVKSPGQ